MNTFDTLDTMASAVETHFRNTDMPEFVECTLSDSRYAFTTTEAPYAVANPEGYRGDDDLYYWGANTPFTNPLHLDGYTLTSMHSSEYPSAGFIASHLRDLAPGTPTTLGCVIVSFDTGDDEWAWVTS